MMWKFREMSRGEINIDPIESEFFSTEALGSLSDALIREAVQNSLDAGIPGEKVRVVISFSSSDHRLPASKSEPYLRNLQQHLNAEKSGLAEQVTLNEPVDYIIIEDMGTRGLEGNIREDEDKGLEETKNDFFYFWRNIGRAVEGSTARGRWGLGKTVFQAASRINSFFGLTIRRNDRSRFLMGQSVLKIHWSDGRKYAPYGYYGKFEGDFAVPVEDKDIIDNFCSDFYLKRANESGLSVVIPYPDKEITPEAVIRAAVDQYFFPILSGDLAVTVAVGHNQQILNSESIFRFVSDTDWPDRNSVLKRLELAQWGLVLTDDAYERIKEPSEDQAPRWEETLIPKERLEYIRRKFEDGKRIALIVPVWIKKNKGSLQHSSFRVIMEKDETLERGEDYFIRDGVSITGVSSLRQRGIRVIVSVSDRPLSKFLGDSENPAHTEWQERSPKFKGKYDRGPSCLRFVKNSPREIFRMLSRPAEGRDSKLLKHVFYIQIPEEKETSQTVEEPAGKPGAGEPGAPKPQLVIPPSMLQLKRTKRGFVLSPNPEANNFPKMIRLEVAYDVRQGSAFKKYQTYDFELNKPPIEIKGKNIQTSVLKPNVLQIMLQSPDFLLQVAGFDPNRDLKIKTTTSLDANT